MKLATITGLFDLQEFQDIGFVYENDTDAEARKASIKINECPGDAMEQLESLLSGQRYPLSTEGHLLLRVNNCVIEVEGWFGSDQMDNDGNAYMNLTISELDTEDDAHAYSLVCIDNVYLEEMGMVLNGLSLECATRKKAFTKDLEQTGLLDLVKQAVAEAEST